MIIYDDNLLLIIINIYIYIFILLIYFTILDQYIIYMNIIDIIINKNKFIVLFRYREDYFVIIRLSLYSFAKVVI